MHHRGDLVHRHRPGLVQAPYLTDLLPVEFCAGRPPFRPRVRRRKPGACAFTDQVALELGERSEDVEHERAARSDCVDRFGQRAELHYPPLDNVRILAHFRIPVLMEKDMGRAVYDFQSLNKKTAIGRRCEVMSEEIIQFDQAMFESKLDAMVREKVERTVNAMLDAEADEIANAARYERSGGRKAYRAGHYERSLTAKAGRLEPKVPKLKGSLFESAVIERLSQTRGKRRGGADRHVAGRRAHQAGRRHRPAAVGRPHAVPDIERQTQARVRRDRRMAHEAVG